MTVLCGIDLETTGLDRDKDYIIEMAWVVMEAGSPKPLNSESHFVRPADHMMQDDKFITSEIYQLTKIEMKHIRNGLELVEVFRRLYQDLTRFGVTHMVAHNGMSFDRPFVLSKLDKLGIRDKHPVSHLPWIDTMLDIDYPAKWSRDLVTLAAQHGFLNPFPHDALMDVMSTLKLLNYYDVAALAVTSESPLLLVKAMVTYDDREKAKERKFRWESVGDHTVAKSWVKIVRACNFERECEGAPFEIKKVRELS